MSSEHRKILLDAAVAHAKRSLEDKGEVWPFWSALDRKMNIHLIPARRFMESPASKDQLADILKNYVQKHDIIAAAFVSEAWMVVATGKTKEQVDSEPPPSEHPDRKECVWVLAEDEEEWDFVMCEILRDRKGRPSLTLAKDAPCDAFESRFTIWGGREGRRRTYIRSHAE